MFFEGRDIAYNSELAIIKLKWRQIQQLQAYFLPAKSKHKKFPNEPPFWSGL